MRYFIPSLTIFIATAVMTVNSYANTARSPDLPLSHCYHWLKSGVGYLDFKYNYAAKNGGELTFYTTAATSNGAVAGPGLYCAKSPSGSYNYGDRVIKIEFVRDVVINNEDTGKNVCGTDGNFYDNDSECQSKRWDVQLYNSSSDWYVIQNPNAIARWTSVSNDLIQDLKDDASYGGSGYSNHAAQTIAKMQKDTTSKTAGGGYYINSNARMSLAAMIKKNPALLNSIPTMSILGELTSPSARKDLPADTLKMAMNKTARRFLLDEYMSFGKVASLLRTDSTLKASFSQEAGQIASEISNGTLKSANLSSVVAALNMSSDTSGRDYSRFFALLLKDSAAVASIDLDGQTLQPGLESQVAKALGPAIQSIPGLLERLSIAQQLNMSAAFVSPVKQNLNDLVAKSGIKDHGLKTNSGFYPIMGTVQDSIGLCTSYISSLKIYNEDIVLKIGETELDLGRLPANASAKAYCQSKADYFKGLVKSLSSGGQQVLFVHGTLQGVPFVFQALYIEDLMPQLTQFLRDHAILSVNEINFRINNRPFQKVKNDDSFWTTSNQILNGMKTVLAQNGIVTKKQSEIRTNLESTAKTKAFLIEGTINTQNFSMAVDNLSEAVQKCGEYASAYDMSAVDLIQVSVNKKPGMELKNPKSYWQGPDQVCQVLSQILNKALKKAR